jgi:hypothetical protein
MCGQCYMQDYDARRKLSRSERRRKAPEDFAPNYRKPPVRAARASECGHPDVAHAAHGLCRNCYAKQGPARATCHPERRLRADGLCNSCYSKRRYEADPELYQQRARDHGRRIRNRDRAELLAAYGGKCTCPRCPETNSAFLTLEHVNGDGSQHRRDVGSHSYADLRRRGFPQGDYTLLCMNCNHGSRFTGICPHMQDEA